jgi:crotonobetainyl-CoA:carnitine CoA-transferase CaiB-like acyl-CoA transferase
VQFYSVLHDGHRCVTLDFARPDGLNIIRGLLQDADAVLEASRPRALRLLGVAADAIMADGRERVWIRISGHGHEQNRIAFGDDAAVAGGLVAWDASGPVFAGDPIAEPLTGILAAVAANACVRAGGSWVIDLTMAGIAALAVTGAAAQPTG